MSNYNFRFQAVFNGNCKIDTSTNEVKQVGHSSKIFQGFGLFQKQKYLKSSMENLKLTC